MKEYEYIVEDIKNKIITQQLKPGDRLPSIKKMTELYHVSSITVRNSLSLLTHDGYIETRERSGSYVKDQKNDSFFMRFDETANLIDQIEAIKTLSISRIHDFNLDNYHLKYSQVNNQNVTKIRRLITSYLDAPILYDVKYIIHPEQEKAESEQMLDNIYQVDQYLETGISKTLQMKLVTPSKEIIELLQIREKTPVFYFEQQYYDKDKKIVAIGQTYVLAESVKLFASSKKN